MQRADLVVESASAHEAAVPEESDFSLRKLKIATAIIVGTLFGSTVLPMMSLGLLLLPMTGEFGWSRAGFSLGMSAMMLGGALSAPVLGSLVDRVGVRPMIISGTVLVGLMTMALSLQTGSLWQFLAGFAVLGALGSTAVGYAKVLGALFNKHRGKALAILRVSNRAWPVRSRCRSSSGRWSTMAGAGSFRHGRDHPGNRAIAADLAAGARGAFGSAGAAGGEVPGMPLAEALRTQQFWLITLAGFLAIIPRSA